MNVKNILKNVDYKGLALQHCEKAAIVVVTALLVMFLFSGVRKAMSASSVTPQRIDQLADDLNRKIQTSEWNEGVAEREQVKNPDFKAQIEKLMSGIKPDEFALSQLFFNFIDYGGILRQKPDILTPYHSLAVADRGALALYKVNSKGEFIEREVTVRATPKPKADDDKDKGKNKGKAAVAKGTPKQMRSGGGMMSGGPGGAISGGG